MCESVKVRIISLFATHYVICMHIHMHLATFDNRSQESSLTRSAYVFLFYYLLFHSYC